MYKEGELIQKSRQDVQPLDIKGTYNLLSIPFINRLTHSGMFPYLIQFIIMLALLGFIVSGWRQFGKESITVRFIWGIWWPSMIIIAVLFGRIWCMICPLELISRMGSKVSDVLHLKKLSANRIIRSGLIILLLYTLIQLLESSTEFHEVPAYTSIFLFSLAAFAFFAGFIYNYGSFCKGFCPISLTLNAYGGKGMLVVRAASEYKCSRCKEKNCIKPVSSEKLFQPRNCPASIYPPNLKNSSDCLLCGQCIKSCSSGNIQVLFNSPFKRNNFKNKYSSWILTLFIIFDSGFVMGELFEEWPPADKIFMKVPQMFSDLLNLQSAGWVEGIWTLLVFPFIFWTISGAVLRITGAAESISDSWKKYALDAVVIFSSLHVIKSVLMIFGIAE